MELTAQQLDTLTELINIGMGRAAGMLNSLLRSHVRLQVPSLRVLCRSKLLTELDQDARTAMSIVHMGFKGPFSGSALLAFPPASASNLVDVLTGGEPSVPDLDMLRVGALTEVGNIVLNGVMGSLSNVLQQRLSYVLPTYMEDSVENLLLSKGVDDPLIIMARTDMRIDPFQIEGCVILLFQVESFDALLSIVNRKLHV